MKLFKDKKTLALIVVLLLIVGGGIYFVMGRNSTSKTTTEDAGQEVKQIKASDIGLTLTPRADNRAITMKISKLAGISSIEYEVEYNANVNDPEAGGETEVPRGVVGSPIEVKSSDTSITREILLGTCSANVCKYDEVTSDVKFLIKVNYKNGEVGSLEKSIAL